MTYRLIVFTLCLIACFGLAATLHGQSSHPALREAPPASNRPRAEAGPAAPAHFVDATRGDDANDGSEASPWRTLRHAVTRLKAGSTLYLRGGVFYEQTYLALAGRPEQPITIRSYPGEQAILDGSWPEFFTAPATSWMPRDENSAGHEFVSTNSYPNVRDVVGSFGDSMIGLQTYYYGKDLGAENELIDWEDWDRQAQTDIRPLYCGPGLWLDRQTGKIHCRLAPTHLPAPIDNYRGPADPRQVPLIVAPFNSTPLTVDACQHLKLQDLVIRGAGYTSIDIRNCSHLELDNVTVWCGTYGLRLTGTDHFKLLNSRLYGSLAPWTFRNDASKRDYPGRPHRNISRLNTHALIELDAGRESSVFAFPQNDHWEIANCHLADAHDGVYLGGINVKFHDNLIENLQDDGIYLSPMYLRHRLDKTDPQIHIYSNTFRQLLTPLAFGGDRPEANDRVFIYRNLFDLTKPVNTGRPSTRQPLPSFSSGKPLGDHGSPPWSAMSIYHNTFVMAEPARDAAMNALGSNREGHPRRVFNNLFLHRGRLPGFFIPPTEHNVISDGNWYWSPHAEEQQVTGLFAKYLKSPEFEASKQVYPGGCESNSRCADPQVVRFDANPSADYDVHLAKGSPLIDAGVAIPVDWPDPAREHDAGRPDIGAFPFGKAVLKPAPK